IAFAGGLSPLNRIRVDDERPVETFMNMSFQRSGMAVIQVNPKGFGIELVSEYLAGLDISPTDACHTIKESAVDAVEMHGVRVGAVIDEMNTQTFPFVAPQGGAGHLTVIGPGREEDSRRDLDLLVHRHDLPFTYNCAVLHCGWITIVEGGQKLGWIEPHPLDIDIPDRDARTVTLRMVHVLGLMHGLGRNRRTRASGGARAQEQWQRGARAGQCATGGGCPQ